MMKGTQEKLQKIEWKAGGAGPVIPKVDATACPVEYQQSNNNKASRH